MARCVRSASGHRTPGDALLMLEMELSTQDSQRESRHPVEMRPGDRETQRELGDLPDSHTQVGTESGRD